MNRESDVQNAAPGPEDIVAGAFPDQWWEWSIWDLAVVLVTALRDCGDYDFPKRVRSEPVESSSTTSESR
jgi:hypothetical protein